MKKILLADNHNIVRFGTKVLVNERFPGCKIDEASTEKEISRLMKHNNYDLIIIEVEIPDTDFPKLMQWIKVTSPDTNVLVFTMRPEDMYGLRCFTMGAKGFLNKNESIEELITVIHKMLNGEKYISLKLSELLLESYNRTTNHHNHTNPFDNLSQREMEMVKHLDNGKTLNEICTISKIQYSTANTYKRRIFEKLNVKTVLELSRLFHSFNGRPG